MLTLERTRGVNGWYPKILVLSLSVENPKDAGREAAKRRSNERNHGDFMTVESFQFQKIMSRSSVLSGAKPSHNLVARTEESTKTLARRRSDLIGNRFVRPNKAAENLWASTIAAYSNHEHLIPLITHCHNQRIPSRSPCIAETLVAVVGRHDALVPCFSKMHVQPRRKF